MVWNTQDSAEEISIFGPSSTTAVAESANGVSLPPDPNALSTKIEAVNDQIDMTNHVADKKQLHEHMLPMSNETGMANVDLGKVEKDLSQTQTAANNFQIGVTMAPMAPGDDNGGPSFMTVGGAIASGFGSLGAKMRGHKGERTDGKDDAEQALFDRQEAQLDHYEQKGDHSRGMGHPHDALLAKYGMTGHHPNISGGHAVQEGQLFTADIKHGLSEKVGIRQGQASLAMA